MRSAILACLICLARAAVAAPVQIPALDWTPRSDWIDVKKDVTPRAVGDGRVDDTAAIQAALDRLSESNGGRCTVYLPAGTYRITRTLAVHKRDGITIVGHGRNTRVVWDGPGGTGDDSRMFWSEGAPRSLYVGITWDGNGRANVGFDHDSHSYFETEIDHEDEAFVNFPGAGVRVGHNQTAPGSQAAAETNYVNCLFDRCGIGLSLLQFNDYDHTVAGCEFRDCGIGVSGGAGPNFYVRDSRFERSARVDVHAAGEHGLSVRRCVSVGSRMFLDGACIAPLVVEGCRVVRWTNPTGAMTLAHGPAVVFDCVFALPPSRAAPIVPAGSQRLIASQNRSDGTDAVVKPGASPYVVTVPAGALQGAVPDEGAVFLTAASRPPARVLDARRDFGARGDGKSDDTAPIEAAIAAARRAGKGATAYLPSGDYVVTRTLELSGSDYRLAGSGTHTRLLGRGLPRGPLARVRGARGVTIENLALQIEGAQEGSAEILCEGTGAPSSVRFHRVWASGMYAKKPTVGGFQFEGLGARDAVLADHVNGNLRFRDCARATALFNTSFEGAITIEGRGDRGADGLLGFMTRLGTINVFGLYVRDSQSVVMSDYYVEQAEKLFSLEGKAGDPAGSVTIQMPKSHSDKGAPIEIADYHGRLALMPSMFYPGGVNPARIVQTGSNPFHLVLAACQGYEVRPELALAPSGVAVLAANSGAAAGLSAMPAEGPADIAGALDDLRRLARADLRVNYPWLTRRGRPSPRDVP